MVQDKTIRKPKQKRSINTKEKILEAALKLFCEKGYYKTTTNEIAKVADISIGSLYSYFKDKDTIFLEILEQYHNLFVKANEEAFMNIDIYKSDKKTWLYKFLEGMIKVHEISKELNTEIKILSYSRPEIAAISEKHMVLSRKMALDYFYINKDDFKVKDIEAASIVTFNFASSIVDYIVFENSKIDRARILESTVEALYKFLMV